MKITNNNVGNTLANQEAGKASKADTAAALKKDAGTLAQKEAIKRR
jgi:hypothetical protein